VEKNSHPRPKICRKTLHLATLFSAGSRPRVRPPSSGSCLPSEFVDANISNLIQVADAVGPEDESEYLRDEIVELFAVVQIWKSRAIGATGNAFFSSAALYRAPAMHGFGAVAALAPASGEGPAPGAYQAAKGQFEPLHIVSHFQSPLP
jgi:hypothetical protein